MSNRPFKRNRYFEGQLLTAQDFQDERDYHNGKRQLLNRCLHGPGVAYGLEVALEGHSVVIESGLALDCCGRELLIPEKVEFEFIPEGKPVYLLVQYHEFESDPMPGIGDLDQVQYTRIAESYKLSWGDEDPLSRHQQNHSRWVACEVDHPIPLARVYCWEDELILDQEFHEMIREGR